jgi:chorismate lyase/3-hydroxybenzoate synthase
MISTSRPSALQVSFDAPHAKLVQSGRGTCLELPMPLLAGISGETLGSPDARHFQSNGFLLAEHDDTLIGAALIDASTRLEDPVEQTYRQLLHLTHGWHLYRIWNYIPGINDTRGGLERYQQFNIGRWTAFESCFGRDLRAFMPAASAVGLQGDQAVVIFEAGRTRPNYLENPSQIPAYHYPADYGPRPPSFARGVVIARPHLRTAFLSGTASIEGHRSLGAGDWPLQFRTTLHNIEIMLDRMQVSAALTPERWADAGIVDAHFKCYLRHPESLPLFREWIQDACGHDRHFTYVQADICRKDLDIEIEGVALTTAPPARHES